MDYVLELTRRNDCQGMPWQFYVRTVIDGQEKMAAVIVASRVGETTEQFLARFEPEMDNMKKAFDASFKREGSGYKPGLWAVMDLTEDNEYVCLKS